jgi:hypothetical protein
MSRNTDRRPPRVFISYAWENDAYRKWVTCLAARLRRDGINARLDSWHQGESQTIPAFMNHEVREADKIIVLCSPKYKQNVHAMEGNERVSGAGWEAALITSHMFAEGDLRRVIPVCAMGSWLEGAPSFLAGHAYCDLSEPARFESEYKELLRRITDTREKAPPIGSLPDDLAAPPPEPLAGASPSVATTYRQLRRVKHNLPFVPHGFVGRADELQTLDELLAPTKSLDIADQPRVAITGLGGIGKTLTAVTYAFQAIQRGEYEIVCWVNAAGDDPTSQFAALADEPLALDIGPETGVATVITSVKSHLASAGPHLLIFDNVEFPNVYPQLVPASEHSRVIITTRRRDIESVVELHLDVLPESQAIALVTRDRQYSEADIQAIHQIAEKVGYLTLALGLASRILSRPGRMPSRLLSDISDKGVVDWSANAPLDHVFNKHPSIVRLFDASLDLLDDSSPIDNLARDMLLVAGWVPAPAIPERLLAAAASRVAIDGDRPPSSIDSAFRLADLGLAEIDEHASLTVHPLIAEYARKKGGKRYYNAATDEISGVPTLTERRQAAPLPIAGPVAHQQPLPEELVRSRPDEVYNAAVTLAENRMYSEALWYLMRVLRAQVSIYGCDSYNVFRTQETIGRTLLSLRNPRSAIRYLRNSLTGVEQLFGRGDPATISPLLALGRALCISGNAPEGLPLLGQAEHITEHWLGPLHPATVAATGTTGLLLGLDGQMQPALETLGRSVQKAQTLGENTLLSSVLCSMGSIQLLVGNTPDAVTNHENAYRCAERDKDTNYSDLLLMQFILGQSLFFDGKEKGTRMMIDARDALSCLLGAEHPIVASFSSQLSRLHEVRNERGELENM